MRRKRQHIADESAATDQQDEFHTTYLPIDRRDPIGNFVSTEVLQTSARYFFSRTTTRSFDVCWPIRALGISESHCTFWNSSASAICPHAREMEASKQEGFFTFVP